MDLFLTQNVTAGQKSQSPIARFGQICYSLISIEILNQNQDAQMKSFDRQPPKIAFERLQAKPNALLIDCRTKAEWAYVGVPMLPDNPQKTNFIEWVDTAGQPNPDFLSEVRNIASTDTPLYLICRSGVRSAAACQLLAESGFTALVNIEDGFEGEIGSNGQRASVNGWKYCNLPWKQR